MMLNIIFILLISLLVALIKYFTLKQQIDIDNEESNERMRHTYEEKKIIEQKMEALKKEQELTLDKERKRAEDNKLLVSKLNLIDDKFTFFAANIKRYFEEGQVGGGEQQYGEEEEGIVEEEPQSQQQI